MGNEKILVVTDSSSSLPDSLINELDIQVIPLWLVWDEKCYLDGVDIDSETFYKRLRDSETLPSSTQPSAVEFKEFFQRLSDSCTGIVCVLASSKISGTVDSAEAAKDFIPGLPIEVVDSRFSAMGEGLISAVAARVGRCGVSRGVI